MLQATSRVIVLGLMQRIEPHEVQIAQIHNVEGVLLWNQNVQHVDIGQLIMKS